MSMIEVDYHEVCKLAGKKIDKEKLVERLAMMGAAVEEVQGDKIFIDVLPNRPDWLSVEGLARGLSTFLGASSGLREYSASEVEIEVRVEKSVAEVRPFIACAVVRGVKIDDALIRSMMQIQEKLHETVGRKRSKVAIGIHDLSKITAPFTYKAVKFDEFWWKDHGTELEARFKTWREQPLPAATDAKSATPNGQSKPADAKAATADEGSKPTDAKPATPDGQTGSVPNTAPKPAPTPAPSRRQ